MQCPADHLGESLFLASAESSWPEFLTSVCLREGPLRVSSDACHPEKSEDVFYYFNGSHPYIRKCYYTP